MFIDIFDGNDVQDFEKVKGQVEGVVTKVLQGCTGVQKNYDYRYKKCKEIGLPIGFYHWLSSYSDPMQQAETFYNLIKDYDMDIIPMLDIEAGGEKWGNGINPESYAIRFMNRFKELSGINMIIYSGRCFIEENFSPDFCSKNLWWVADYSHKPNIPKCGTITAWQYSESGSINGITGDVDLDELFEPEHFFLKGYSSSKDNNEVADNTPVGGDERVRKIQEICNKYNDYIIKVDGVWGSKTHEAVSHLPVCKIGSQGSLVEYIQSVGMGWTPPDNDGDFGPATYSGVVDYQSRHNINVDGVVGFDTLTEMILH